MADDPFDLVFGAVRTAGYILAWLLRVLAEVLLGTWWLESPQLPRRWRWTTRVVVVLVAVAVVWWLL